MTGVIFDLKRFAVHDGRGIRSTLFLKGCPLHCPWCQNPEGLSKEVHLRHYPGDCIRCETCISVCPANALTLDERIHIDRTKCISCGACETACPVGAMLRDGQSVSSEEAAQMLLRDRPFFRHGGGVTLSGGEVLMQPDFALEVLKICKEAGVHTAIETCLQAPWETLARFLPWVDQFLADLKYWDSKAHQEMLGVDSRRIYENHRLLVESGADITVRTPLIPGYTATDENIRAIARYLVHTDPNAKYELLNFNPLCRSKYDALESRYPVEGKVLSGEEMEHYYEILRREGVHHIIKE